MTWKSIARSVVGTSHKKQEKPCQDYADYRLVSGVMLGAVADGAGSACFSEQGAKLAVETALYALSDWLDKSGELPRDCAEVDARLFQNVLKTVVEALTDRARELNGSLQDLACTLLLFLATPHWIAAMQLGDGFLVVGSKADGYRLLFTPDHGEFVNETVFVTSQDAHQQMQIGVLPLQPDFICASTDGLERLAIRSQDWTPHNPFFYPLEDYMRLIPEPEQEDGYLIDFLNSERLNMRTDDDKTLLLCLRKGALLGA
jgi:Protein phosphatase 2C